MLTLHDLILKMNVVDTKENKVYFDGLDAFLANQEVEKQPIEFENVDLKR
jgi:hypothetical protein